MINKFVAENWLALKVFHNGRWSEGISNSVVVFCSYSKYYYFQSLRRKVSLVLRWFYLMHAIELIIEKEFPSRQTSDSGGTHIFAFFFLYNLVFQLSTDWLSLFRSLCRYFFVRFIFILFLSSLLDWTAQWLLVWRKHASTITIIYTTNRYR